jgi:hypothetical protein
VPNASHANSVIMESTRGLAAPASRSKACANLVRLLSGALFGTKTVGAGSGLGPRAQDAVEQSIAEAEFSWIANEVETQLVHHVPVSDAGLWIGESE